MIRTRVLVAVALGLVLAGRAWATGAATATAPQFLRARLVPNLLADLVIDDGDNSEGDAADFVKRQPSSDDYGHMRFGKRTGHFDDYGHMRFGKRLSLE